MPLAPGEFYLTDKDGNPISGSAGLSIAGPVSTYTQGAQAITGSVNVYTSGPQAVSGSLAVYTQGAQAVSGTVFVTTTGSLPVVVQGIPQITGSVGVTGSVAITNTVPVAVQGQVSVNNFPATQRVSGSVSIFTQGAQGVTGSVSVFTQGAQQVTGSVLTYTQGPQNVSGSVAVYTQGAQLVSGTIKVFDTGIQAVSGSQVSGSTFHGFPIVAGGVTGSVVTVIQTDPSGTLYITTSGSKGLQVGNSTLQPLYITISSSLPVTGNFGTTDPSGRTLAVGAVASGSTAQGNPIQVSGIDTTNALGTGSIVRSFAVDSLGRIITAPAGTSATTSGFIFGSLSTTLSTLQKMEATTYTEMTGSAQRSIVSTSASDTSAGVGARTVKITYYKNDFSGPFTTTVTLNGVTSVDTTATDICFVEKMEVITAGSTATNVGTISLKSVTGGTGTTIGSIGVGTVVAATGDGRTLWCHHYIPSGLTCNISSLTTGHSSNTSQGSGGLFLIRSLASGSNQTEIQVTDYVHQYGQASSTPRQYPTPVKVTGPARLLGYVLPDSALTVVYHLAFDFYEQ